jgi:hypothetical protein
MVIKRVLFFILLISLSGCGLIRNSELTRGERKLNRLLKRFPELKKDSIVDITFDTLLKGYTKESTFKIIEDTAAIDTILKHALDSIIRLYHGKFIPAEKYDSLLYNATIDTRKKLSKVYKENFIKDTLINDYPDVTVKTWTENGKLRQSVKRKDIAVQKKAKAKVRSIQNGCPTKFFYEGKYFIEFLLGVIFFFTLLLFLILRKL